VFSQLNWKVLFGATWAIIHHENCHLQEVFLSKINSTLTGIHCDKCCSFLHRWFLLEIYVSLQLSLITIIGTKRFHLHLKHLSCRKYSFQKWTQFCHGNNVQNTPVLIHIVLTRQIPLFLQITLTGLFGATGTVIYLEHWDFQEVFLSQTNSVHTGKLYATRSSF
jgi:ABC-type amino acid transport system permease subunit